MPLFGRRPNIEKMRQKGDVGGLINSLGYQKDEHVRVAAERALVQIGEAAVEPLIAALNNTVGNIQVAAIRILGRIGDERAVQHLLGLLNNKYRAPRNAAISALKQIDNTRAIEPFIDGLKDTNPRIRNAAVDGLEQIGDVRAVEPLIAVLKDTDEGVRASSVRALGELGDVRALEPLVAALDDKAMRVREAATRALQKLEWQPHGQAGALYWIMQGEWDKCASIGGEAVAPLIATLQTADWKNSSIVIKTLIKIGDEAVEPLAAMLDDADKFTRKAVVEALSQLEWQPQEHEGALFWAEQGEWDKYVAAGGTDAELLIAALKTRNEQKRSAVIKALAQVGDAAVDPLIATLNDADGTVRLSAIKALGQIGDGRAVEPLMATLETTNWRGREIIFEALGQIGEAQAVEPLIILLMKGKASNTIIQTLETIGDAAVEPLASMLKDTDMRKRKTAVEMLNRLDWQPQGQEGALFWAEQGKWDKYITAGGNDVNLLISALKTSGQRRMTNVIIDALVNIGEPAVEALVVLLDHQDENVRKAAIEILNRLEWQPQGQEGALFWAEQGKWDQYIATGNNDVNLLISALKTQDERMRSVVADALVNIGESAVKPLIAGLKTMDEDNHEAITNVLKQIGYVAVKRLISDLKCADETTHSKITKALGQIGDDAVESLVPLLVDSDIKVRKAAARALVDIYATGNITESTTLKILKCRDTITEPHKNIRSRPHEDSVCKYAEHNDRIVKPASHEGHLSSRHSDSFYNSYKNHTDKAATPHKDTGIGVDFPL